jgi:hypothetical protein
MKQTVFQLKRGRGDGVKWKANFRNQERDEDINFINHYCKRNEGRVS